MFLSLLVLWFTIFISYSVSLMTSYVHPGMATEFRGSFHPNDVHVVY